MSRTKTALAEGAFLDEMENASTPGARFGYAAAWKHGGVATDVQGRYARFVCGATRQARATRASRTCSKFKAKKGKKKLTRNEKKAQEERRRLRLSRWLTYGGEREPDTDDE